MLRRRSTIHLDFSKDDDGDNEMWRFPIGWNRKVDPVTGIALNEPQNERFLSNKIQTAKYTPLNFVPYNLLHQISKASNIYYIVLCVL